MKPSMNDNPKHDGEGKKGEGKEMCSPGRFEKHTHTHSLSLSPSLSLPTYLEEGNFPGLSTAPI